MPSVAKIFAFILGLLTKWTKNNPILWKGRFKSPSGGGFVLPAVDAEMAFGHGRADKRAVMWRACPCCDILAEMPTGHADTLRRDQLALLQSPYQLDN
jgi:hypothetical protein